MKTILIVDDEQAVTLAVELALMNEYNVRKASSGESALIDIEKCRPDVVLMDVMMPGIGGLETLRFIRSQSLYSALPVILMSGAYPLAKKSDYLWSDFLLKPFTRAQLKLSLAKLLPTAIR